MKSPYVNRVIAESFPVLGGLAVTMILRDRILERYPNYWGYVVIVFIYFMIIFICWTLDYKNIEKARQEVIKYENKQKKKTTRSTI